MKKIEVRESTDLEELADRTVALAYALEQISLIMENICKRQAGLEQRIKALEGKYRVIH